MRCDINYDHLKDVLIRNDRDRHIFKEVKTKADEHGLELNDDDFNRFFKLKSRDADISWIMDVISVYKLELADALVSYICY